MSTHNIYFCGKKPDAFNEYPQHMFSWRKKKKKPDSLIMSTHNISFREALLGRGGGDKVICPFIFREQGNNGNYFKRTRQLILGDQGT